MQDPTYTYDANEGNGHEGNCLLCGEALSSPTHEAAILANEGTQDEGTCTLPDEDTGAHRAAQDEAEEKAQAKGTIETASKRLTAILADHKAGKPVIREMAQRINARLFAD